VNGYQGISENSQAMALPMFPANSYKFQNIKCWIDPRHYLHPTRQNIHPNNSDISQASDRE
jgi:hypothetical protein